MFVVRQPESGEGKGEALPAGPGILPRGFLSLPPEQLYRLQEARGPGHGVSLPPRTQLLGRVGRPRAGVDRVIYFQIPLSKGMCYWSFQSGKLKRKLLANCQAAVLVPQKHSVCKSQPQTGSFGVTVPFWKPLTCPRVCQSPLGPPHCKVRNGRTAGIGSLGPPAPPHVPSWLRGKRGRSLWPR